MAGKAGRSVRLNITVVVELRTKKGWNQEDFSKKAKVSKRTIENAETGRPINLNTATKIAAALSVEVHVILHADSRGTETVQVEVDVRVSEGSPSPPAPTVTAVADFTGRVKELAEIAANLRAGTAVCITAIKAAGGMGKTQLARKSSENLTSQFPEGTLLIELDGLTNPKTPLALMREVIRKCQPETGQLPEELEPLRECYLAALGAKKLLLVLDNAADARQVGPVLERLPPMVGVIVTSRKLISLPSVKRIDLEVMTEADALALLGGIVSRERGDLTADDLSAIAKLCGHLPLALRVAGTLLRDDKMWTRKRFAKALADDPLRHLTLGPDEYDVGAVLRLSVQQLVGHNAEQAERFQMLSVFPGTFADDGAAAVWNLDEDETFTDLDELHNRSLIEWDEKKDRYRLHDLMRPVARDAFPSGHARHAGGVERLALARRRHAEHYKDVQGRGESLYWSGHDNVAAGLRLFDTEVGNITSGRAWVFSQWQAEAGDALSELVGQYTLNAQFIHELRLGTHERKSLYEAALPILATSKLTVDHALTQGRFADIWTRLGDSETAIQMLRESIEPLREAKADKSVAVHLGLIADILQQRGELDEALRIRREEQLPVYDRLGDVRSRAVTARKVADILALRGDMDGALKMLQEEALNPILGMGMIADEAVFRGRMANILQQRGELDEALRIHREEQLPVYDRLGDVEARAVTMGQIADILQERGELDEALRIHREEVLPVFDRLGDVRGQLITRAKIGIALLQRPSQTEADVAEGGEHLLWALATAEKHRYKEAAQLREIVQELLGDQRGDG